MTANLPAFTPVPRLKDRSNGWKPEVQQAFIEKLAEYGSVAAACRAVGRSKDSAYQLRRHPEAHEFRAAWEAALDFGVGRIEDVAMERALYGVETPVYSYGKLVGQRTVHNDRLLMFMLRNRAPQRFAGERAHGLSGMDRTRLNQLKKEWRKEWEREKLEDEMQDSKRVFREIDQFIEKKRQNHMANISPGERALEIATKAQRLADSAAGWSPGMPYGPYAEKAAELRPQFIPEIEADWPPLRTDAWHVPEEEIAEWHPADTPHPDDEEWDAEQEEEESGPRIRTLKDGGW